MAVWKNLAGLGMLAFITGCAGLSGSASRAQGAGLWGVPINHTDRYATYVAVDGRWVGGVGEKGGNGGGAACCVPGRKDWTQPVLVKWRWGAEEDPITQEITIPGEEHSAVVHFPRAPRRLNKSPNEVWTSEDYEADEAYLCVILRTLDQVELAFSNTGSGCLEK